VAGEVVAEAVVAVLASEEEAVVVVEELVLAAVVWVPESVRMLDRHKSMHRSLGRLLRRLPQVCVYPAYLLCDTKPPAAAAGIPQPRAPTSAAWFLDMPAQPFRTKLAPTATTSQDFISLIGIPPFVALAVETHLQLDREKNTCQ
jgi:hypothetical protein